MTAVRRLAPFLVFLAAFAGCYAVDYGSESYSSLEGDTVITRWALPPFSWEARFPNVSQRLSAEPGGKWTLVYDVELDLSSYDEKYGEFTELIVGVQAERHYDAEGRYQPGASSFALSSNFTTTGVPVEHYAGWPRFRLLHGKEGSPFEVVKAFPLGEDGPIDAVHDLRGELAVDLPKDTPPGYYEPRFYLFVRVAGVEDPVHIGEFSYEWNEGARPPSLPLVRVGDPAPPKMPWSIFSNFPYGGTDGTLPEEDRLHTELVGRSGFPKSLVLPPGRYVAEPGFPSIFPEGRGGARGRRSRRDPRAARQFSGFRVRGGCLRGHGARRTLESRDRAFRRLGRQRTAFEQRRLPDRLTGDRRLPHHDARIDQRPVRPDVHRRRNLRSHRRAADEFFHVLQARHKFSRR
ncbi:MAG: hypothetical protein M5R36_14070 [Deltaproteobacteria bacterium]|nr:hypothetical protein [Deltaproteobacteria bacterium]